MDLTKVRVDANGMVETAAGVKVNSSNLSAGGYQQALNYAGTVKTPVAPVAPLVTTPGSSFVSSSAPVVTADNNTRKDVATLTAPDNTGAQNASAASIKAIDDYSAQLEARRKSEIDSINASFDETKRQQESAQAKETGSTTVGIARMGGYLGGSGSGTGVMLNLSQSHRQELSALQGKRQSAINEANNAITDKQFTLAREKVKEAKDLESEIYNRNKDFWSKQLQLSQENRAQDSYLTTKAKNTLDVISTTGIATPEAIKEIDSVYGAGTAQKYTEIVNADKTAKSSKAMLENFKAKIDLLESIPQGVQVKFGDETITGIGKTSDIETFHVENAAGRVTLVTHNKATGTYATQDLGNIGTPSSTAGTDPNKITSMTAELSSVANKSTGYVSPTDYKNGLRAWLSTGGQLKVYEDNFKVFADPAQKDKYDFSGYYNKSGDDILQLLRGN